MKANLKGSGSHGSKIRIHSNDLWWYHSEVPSDFTRFNQMRRWSTEARLGPLKSHCCWRSPWGLGAPRETSALTRSLLWQHMTSSTISLPSPSCLWWAESPQRPANVQTCISSFLERSIKRLTCFRTTKWPKVSSSSRGVVVHLLTASGMDIRTNHVSSAWICQVGEC